MRHFSILFVLIVSSTTLFAQTEKPVPSTIQAVTVFRQGAEIVREAKTQVPKGTTQLVFTNLTAQMDPASVQISGNGNLAILSVLHRINYLENASVTNEIKQLQRSISSKQDSLQNIGINQEVLQSELDMILTNKEIGGTQSGVSLTELKNTAEYYRTHLTEIKTKLLELRRLQTGLQTRINALNAQTAPNSVNKQPVSEIVVTVQVDAPAQGIFSIRYLSPQARWQPMYDVRVTEVGKPLQLTYKADVIQNTNELWDNVQLTLSTANPSESGVQPTLQPWRLGFLEDSFGEDNVVSEAIATGAISSRRLASRAAPMNDGEELKLQEKPIVAPLVRQSDNATSVSFTIDAPYTIPSDNNAHTVQVKQPMIPAQYEYFAAPKFDTDAFLTAQITDWQNYALVSAPANLFLEDSFVGKTILNAVQTQDTLTVSLGRDKSIITKRTKLKGSSNRAFLSNKKTETLAFEIEVRNTKRVPIRLVVRDQIPVSADDKIVIKLDESSGATVAEDSGFLTWRLNLNAGETRKLTFKYTVTYPKEKQIVLE
jgi:uncharacterized protein (TIGR02231 family)